MKVHESIIIKRLLIIFISLLAILLIVRFFRTDKHNNGEVYNDSIKARNDSLNTYYNTLKSRNDSINNAIADSIRKKNEYLASIKWHKGYYVDDFGDPTNNSFIKTTTEGIFSNSAVSNEYLYVEIYIDKNSAGIFLHEYSSSNPAEYFIDGEGEMKLKNRAGNILTITSFGKWNNSGGLSINNYSYYNAPTDHTKLVNFLKRSIGEIKVSIKDSYSSTYFFVIDATGFTDGYNNL